MNEITDDASLDSVNATTSLATVDAAALSGLERRVQQHEDHLRRLDANVEEDASAILDNQNRFEIYLRNPNPRSNLKLKCFVELSPSLVRLSEMVTYFRQNVLKVKKLPAMMNALERRIEVLDDNFAKLILSSSSSRPRNNEGMDTPEAAGGA